MQSKARSSHIIEIWSIKKMLYCPLGAKTWVGQWKSFFFFNLLFFSSLFGQIFLSFGCFDIKKEKKRKKEKKDLKADSRFQDFGVGRKGQYKIPF